MPSLSEDNLLKYKFKTCNFVKADSWEGTEFEKRLPPSGQRPRLSVTKEVSFENWDGILPKIINKDVLNLLVNVNNEQVNMHTNFLKKTYLQ